MTGSFPQGVVTHLTQNGGSTELGTTIFFCFFFFCFKCGEASHVYTYSKKGNCLLPAAAPGHSRALTKESSYQMKADPLIRCQQLDDWQCLPGQGIVETGEDVLLAHQLRDQRQQPVSTSAPTTPLLPPPWGGPGRGAKTIHLARPQPQIQRRRGGSQGGRAGTAEGGGRSGSREGAKASRPAGGGQLSAGHGGGGGAEALPTETLPSPRVSTAQARQSGGRSGSAQRAPCPPAGRAHPSAIAQPPPNRRLAHARGRCPRSGWGEAGLSGTEPGAGEGRKPRPSSPAPGLAAAWLPAATQRAGARPSPSP